MSCRVATLTNNDTSEAYYTKSETLVLATNKHQKLPYATDAKDYPDMT